MLRFFRSLSWVILASIVLVPCSSSADTVAKFYNNYSFQTEENFFPTDRNKVNVDTVTLKNSVEIYQKAVMKELTINLSVQPKRDFLRMVFRWDNLDQWDIIEDFQVDPSRHACFGKGKILRCYVVIGVRKNSIPGMKPIDTKKFNTVQMQYVLRRLPDGRLRVFAECDSTHKSCAGVEWK